MFPGLLSSPADCFPSFPFLRRLVLLQTWRFQAGFLSSPTASLLSLLCADCLRYRVDVFRHAFQPRRLLLFLLFLAPTASATELTFPGLLSKGAELTFPGLLSSLADCFPSFPSLHRLLQTWRFPACFLASPTASLPSLPRADCFRYRNNVS